MVLVRLPVAIAETAAGLENRMLCGVDSVTVSTLPERTGCRNTNRVGGNVNSPHKQGVKTSCLPTTR